ncbi:alkyl sulfatase dimerization domain-containing protein [Litorivivens sp.]|uniref:alkyl sulfatase dimerization domain-containing protein n=2 Tax=Litorivivens sp. TaxID=2020868 RepID=UPI003563E176
MREPLYKTRRVAPEAAGFNERCSRVNDFIVMTEACSNVYLIETPEGGILINSGMGFEAPVIHHNLKRFSNVPVKYLITTQGHVDHVGGVQYFRDQYPGLRYIATAENEEHQNYDARLQPFRGARSAFRFQDDFIQVFTKYAQAGYTDINAQDRPTPDITFEQRHEFSLGGLELVLLAVPGAETNDSLIVWLPQHDTIFTGNLFGCAFGHFPNLVTIRGDRYRDALTCAAAAQTVMDLKPQRLLYGHHEPIDGADIIKAELTAYRDAVVYVHDEVVKGMNAGKDLHTLQQEITLPPQCEVGQGYGKVSWGVRAIWENYAGWFKHESTTELYSVPQKSVHTELVRLAGAQQLIASAREKRDAGRLEEALHLLDIVLSAEPENAEAKLLSVQVHQTLLADAADFAHTGNFWLTGWLENQIKLLQGGETAPLSFK